MKSNFKKFIAVFIIFFLTGCNTLKEGLEGNRKSKNAEGKFEINGVSITRQGK